MNATARIGIATLAMAGLLSAPAGLSAQSLWPGFDGRLWAGTVGRYVLKDNDTFTDPVFGTVALKVKGSSFGFGGDVERRFNRWVGLDAAVGFSSLSVQFNGSNNNEQTRSMAIVPILVSLNVHLITTQTVDFWAGPQIGDVIFPDDVVFKFNGGSSYTYSPSDVFSAKGFNVGADIALKRHMALNLAFRWQDADGDSDSHLTIDPTFVTVGLSWRY